MALDEIVGGVKKVDLGDLTKKVNVGDRVEAVKRMLGDAGEKVAEKADDWGWKGGKPGEVTAGQLKDLRARGDLELADIELRDHVDRFSRKYPDSPLVKQMKSGSGTRWIDNTLFEVRLFEDVMSAVEQADVPRKWTGLVAAALPKSAIAGPGGKRRINRNRIKDFADLMRPMTNDQREFTGSAFRILNTQRSGPGELDVKRIGAALRSTWRQLTNDQREAFLALLPEWTESLDDLVAAVRTI